MNEYDNKTENILCNCCNVFASIAFAAPEKKSEIQLPLKQSPANTTPVKPANPSSVPEKLTEKPKTNELKENKSASILSDFIPITAAIAILLFIAREIFDLMKKETTRE